MLACSGAAAYYHPIVRNERYVRRSTSDTSSANRTVAIVGPICLWWTRLHVQRSTIQSAWPARRCNYGEARRGANNRLVPHRYDAIPFSAKSGCFFLCVSFGKGGVPSGLSLLALLLRPPVGVEVSPVNVSDAGEIERAVTAFARSANGGLIVTGSARPVWRSLSTKPSSATPACHSRCP
jgi:hypothetical protein